MSEDSNRKSVRSQLIEEAMVNCHDARADVLKAQQLEGQVTREYRLRLQQAIIEYYYALRPLREESPIEDWWNDVTLSKQWIKDEREEKEVVGNIESGVVIEENTVTEYYDGLDHIERLKDQRETRKSVKTGMMGRRETVETVQKVLDAPVLLDISSTLDDAATKLGFAPESRTPVEDDPAPI